MEAFDDRPIESVPAIRLLDKFAHYCGASFGCDYDFTADPAFAKFKGISGEDLGQPVGEAAQNAILAEVERLHRGDAGNRDAAEWLFRKRMEAKAKQGHVALESSSCAAMRPDARSALLEVDEFSP
jgi:hypothetical protein